jgi:Fe-S cluster assembly protein SufD
MTTAATAPDSALTIAQARAALEARAARSGEPDFLRARRLEALEQFERARMPDPLRDEEWRRMTLAGLDLEARPLAAEDAYAVAGGAGSLPPGAFAGTIAEAARARPDLVERWLGHAVPASRGKLEALSLALFSAGALVYVPDGAALERTVLLRGAAAPAAGAPAGAGFGAFRRSVVVLGRGARATVVSLLESAEGPGLHVGALEVVLGEGASLRHATVQVLGSGTWSFETRRALVGRDARIEWVTCDLGARVARATVETLLAEPGGRAESRGMVFGDGKQHVDLGVRMLHRARDTEGDMLVRAALGGSARAVYRGHVEIAKGARGTNNQQKEAVLLLSSEARSDAIPSLFIDENDVKAGHGATAGRVDDRMLFYLMSRGIRRRTAEKLVVEGFFAPLLERISIDELREDLLARIDRKIEGAGA